MRMRNMRKHKRTRAHTHTNARKPTTAIHARSDWSISAELSDRARVQRGALVFGLGLVSAINPKLGGSEAAFDGFWRYVGGKNVQLLSARTTPPIRA
jgi:hypothetical protein